ncbi:retropepsin-like aspartic protease [Mucilaginibacter paludis]|uniref:Peptidase A2 domain-containing protein n=1 Tax=Mucilaginibacter paludis DSM 18603 TaxID=714943 RepID=H1YCI4_9SPHI|nr:retropepsin-like aspartic protease [Mucilaginibacter paludis]EHQ30662.1 hypothetical protein Mucpa_6611 [Mucilaginibacter paludis DSM 18603]
MKATLSILLLLVTLAAYNHKPSLSAAAAKKLQNLLDNKEYFKLEAQTKLYKDSLDEEKNLYYSSIIDNVFNRNIDCINDVNRLLINFSDQLPDSVKVNMRRLQSDSYFKTYQYAKAAQTDSTTLKLYSKSLSKDVIEDLKKQILIRNALKDTPRQQSIIKRNTLLSWSHNKLGLIEIPVKCSSIVYNAVFDTRANISAITKTYAKKLGLHMLNVSFDESSGETGLKFKTTEGVADSIDIGGILIKNVVFEIMPDSVLYISAAKFQLNIIIGYPVIEQFGEVHIYNNGKMTIPLIPTKGNLHNFALDGLDPIVALKKGNDTLAFHFDTGASSSLFYVSYFNKYKTDIIKSAKKKTVGFFGAGGSQKKEVYVLPQINLTLGNKTVTMNGVDVLQQKIVPNEKFYGNIGQDFTKNFIEIIYNFKYMYVNGN